MSKLKEQELTDQIQLINWGGTSPAERRTFTEALAQLEIAALVDMQAATARRSRLSSLVVALVGVLLASLLGAAPPTLIMVALGTQLLMFVVSQVLENASKKLLAAAEARALERVEFLAKRHPLPPAQD